MLVIYCLVWVWSNSSVCQLLFLLAQPTRRHLYSSSFDFGSPKSFDSGKSQFCMTSWTFASSPDTDKCYVSVPSCCSYVSMPLLCLPTEFWLFLSSREQVFTHITSVWLWESNPVNRPTWEQFFVWLGRIFQAGFRSVFHNGAQIQDNKTNINKILNPSQKTKLICWLGIKRFTWLTSVQLE